MYKYLLKRVLFFFFSWKGERRRWKNLPSFFPVAQYRGKERYFEKENCSFGNRRIRFFSALDESRRGFARAKRIRIGAASALLRGKARTVKENGGEKTKEHFDNEVLLEQKLFSSTQFHPTFNNLPVLKPFQIYYISIYSSVPFLFKRTTLLSISSEIQAKEAEKHTNRREKSRKKATSIPTRTLY